MPDECQGVSSGLDVCLCWQLPIASRIAASLLTVALTDCCLLFSFLQASWRVQRWAGRCDAATDLLRPTARSADSVDLCRKLFAAKV